MVRTSGFQGSKLLWEICLQSHFCLVIRRGPHFICFSKHAVIGASSPMMMKNVFSVLDFSVSHSWKEINAAITEAINVASGFFLMRKSFGGSSPHWPCLLCHFSHISRVKETLQISYRLLFAAGKSFTSFLCVQICSFGCPTGSTSGLLWSQASWRSLPRCFPWTVS